MIADEVIQGELLQVLVYRLIPLVVERLAKDPTRELRERLRLVLRYRRIHAPAQLNGHAAKPGHDERGRLGLALEQLDHMDHDALVFTAGVFAVAGASDDYVDPVAFEEFARTACVGCRNAKPEAKKQDEAKAPRPEAGPEVL